jgi:hypothetical protein
MPPRAPKPFEVFKKPRHPRHNWDGFNAANHARAVLAAIAHDERVREGRKRKGMPSLKRTADGRKRKDNRVRFGSLPKRSRPAAEIELSRLITRHILRTGHPPSPAKHASLMGNAAWIVKHAHSGNLKTWISRNFIYRRMLDKMDAKAARQGTPAAEPTTPKPRSSWRGLTGI